MQNSTRAIDEKLAITAFPVHTEQPISCYNNRDRFGPLCRHCNHSGHLSENCFAVVGYPEWWGDRPRMNGGH